ncbi:alpha-amylase family protein [Aurantimonas endophytica]|uniref:Maltose alpha-D-glucosyltransferase/alpha-amylase n=1 Tax=Aurantimonas endophytica TaxID=1522175 RepID=A0A7W6MPR2_9HYPH|nr:alpha-amylase family protein [Aurantimonas endophytica]MBB4003137.1 maltose alpha-D-glucosyltransferase/alpha-amylase [Aurantimonas endophytica]MCO6404008.1 trehalose synthase [Aurantimonas endophytica]
MLNLWYKNAVIYCVDVDAFMDQDGDGIGDFKGLTDRLDHIEALGANCIWLLPFYPTPNKDNGYDISDYFGVDSRLGTLGDFVEFTHAARDRGLKVIVDLVVNHSSIEHPWFQASRAGHPKYKDWYVWKKERPEDHAKGVIFPGVQESTWTFDRKRQEYYFHRFYKHQADLNIANPEVREEIDRIMGFWLALGVSGFRIDAVPFLIEDLVNAETGGSPHDYLGRMRQFLDWRQAEAILLAEANIPMEEAGDYFGDGDRLNLIFNFPLNQRLFLALARRDGAPVRDFLEKLPEIPPTSQWATFLRNHDEIDLGRLSDEERQEAFAAFGPEKSMQIYDRGIRRRLAPMLGGDERRIEMAMSLMLSLPGTPVIWYGDEIGMGDNLDLPERTAVRTPMQWSSEPNGGFSKAAPEDCVRQPVADGPFAYAHVNAESQRVDPNSMFSVTQRLIRARRSAPEIGWGSCRVIDLGETSVVALLAEWRGGRILTLHNLGEAPVTIDCGETVAGAPVRPLLQSGIDIDRTGGACRIRLGAFGYEWLRVAGDE